jgi:polyhydroxyalkanoate synthase
MKMAETAAADNKNIDPAELSQTLISIAGKSQQLVRDFLVREQSAQHIGVEDALHMSRLFQQLTSRLMANPVALVQAQMGFWQDYMALVQGATLRMFGFQSQPVIEPKQGDKRFKNEAWEENPVFDFIKQSYLLTADYIHSTVRRAEGLDDLTAKKIDFYTRQFIDAMSPTNFAATNPEVIKKTLESRGQNLLKGLHNLLDDLSRGKGNLSIKMTDMDAFKLGENIATTPGKVIFQNDMMQLLQYSPTTETVSKRPVLFIPPWINKYYILDLRQDNSLIKYMVDQGFTVFVISWRNPTEGHADKGFDDYMLEGPLAALSAIEQATGEKSVNMVGYCLGGTLLGATLAYMAAKGDKRAASATFFTSMLDFCEPGELEIFIDDDQISSLEKRMGEQGYLSGRTMAATMSSLRANDLIWSFFVNNYLHGNDPFPFDLLFWNADSTNMPAKMHSFYLRNMYQKNQLKEPGGIELAGVKIDLRKIKVPVYFISTREDHLAPWKTAYQGVHLVSGPVKFVLGGSGHIAGIVNPPAKKKYGYWTNPETPADAEQWLAGASQSEGSWWPDWRQWLKEKAGEEVPARKPGEGKLQPVEDAPGSYVKERVG